MEDPARAGRVSYVTKNKEPRRDACNLQLIASWHVPTVLGIDWPLTYNPDIPWEQGASPSLFCNNSSAASRSYSPLFPCVFSILNVWPSFEGWKRWCIPWQKRTEKLGWGESKYGDMSRRFWERGGRSKIVKGGALQTNKRRFPRPEGRGNMRKRLWLNYRVISWIRELLERAFTISIIMPCYW